MSILVPVIVILETAIILWLLVALAQRPSIASHNPPHRSVPYAERATIVRRKMRPNGTTIAKGAARCDSLAKPGSSGETREKNDRGAEIGQREARADNPLTERLNATAAETVLHRVAYRGDPRLIDIQGDRARAVAQKSDERYFREALALLPFAILMLGERGLMVMVNPQAAKLFGYECDEMIGKPIEILVPDLHFDGNVPVGRDPPALKQIGGMVPSRELSGRRKDGTEFPVEIGLSEFASDADKVTLAFIIDRTDRYELHRNRQELAHLTRVSTMGQLASSLAHELNQPLTAILSNVQAAQRFMAADRIDLGEVREILNDIVQDDFRASEVIRRIRAVVKKGDLDVAPLYLAGVIRDAILLLHSDAIVRGIRVTLDIDGELSPVLGDKVQLQKVILNLLLNAFDAMNNVPPLDRVVSVTLRPENNGMVCIALRDRGHGLTSDKLDQIFTAFFTSKPHGLGLGLSISRSIIDMHRGRLWAQNNIDRGATFYVTLPAVDATELDKSRYRL